MKRFAVCTSHMSSAARSEEASSCCAPAMTHTDRIFMDTTILVSIFAALGLFMRLDIFLPLQSIIIFSLLARITMLHPILKEPAVSS